MNRNRIFRLALLFLGGSLCGCCSPSGEHGTGRNAPDTVYVEKIVYIHDTVYIAPPPPPKPRDIQFQDALEEALQEDYRPLYDAVTSIGPDNLSAAKALYERCTAAARETVRQMKQSYAEEHPDADPEEVDAIATRVLIQMQKPYLRMLSDYGKSR